jgi:hypothetical protein
MQALMEAKIEGADEAIAKLKRLGADLIGIVEPAFQRGGYRVENELKEYPPQEPTDYVRTNLLGKSTFMEPMVRTADELRLNLGSPLTYAPFVRSKALQAWMHEGRWPTDEDILAAEIPRTSSEMSAALRRAAGGG